MKVVKLYLNSLKCLATAWEFNLNSLFCVLVKQLDCSDIPYCALWNCRWLSIIWDNSMSKTDDVVILLMEWFNIVVYGDQQIHINKDGYDLSIHMRLSMTFCLQYLSCAPAHSTCFPYSKSTKWSHILRARQLSALSSRAYLHWTRLPIPSSTVSSQPISSGT